jgi:hypothetical protein
MLNTKALQTATMIGTVLQIAMVLAGHFVPYIALHVFMFGGMGISLLAGFLYGRTGGGYGGASLGGAIAGGVCALIGIAMSVVLHDTMPVILAIGTISSTVTGLIGGVLGKLTAGSAATA